jgi:hypothetical protein
VIPVVAVHVAGLESNIAKMGGQINRMEWEVTAGVAVSAGSAVSTIFTWTSSGAEKDVP